MKRIIFFLIILSAIGFASCKKYLNVAPDNIATIENAFALREQAMKYLFTCYSYMPDDHNTMYNPAHTAGDEIWPLENFVNGFAGAMYNIAIGNQNVVNPYGSGYWTELYKGIRDCNIFLDNIGRTPGMTKLEKQYWVAEVKFLKAYYHYYLTRLYGPIPLIKKNLPLDAPIEQTQVYRDPVDSCFGYITQLLDEAKDSLPDMITDAAMYGRIDRPVVYALKAKVLVTAASPLYNGNTDQASLKDNRGIQLFNQTYSAEKWQKAATACKEAVDLCQSLNYQLYKAPANIKSFQISNTIRTQLSIRNSFSEPYNSEIIWANVRAWARGFDNIQELGMIVIDPRYTSNTHGPNRLNAPLKIVEMFYTKNGVPIDEDKTWDVAQKYTIKTVTDASQRLYLRMNYQTAGINLYREPRFYANLGFDGNVWYGNGRYDDNAELFYVEGKSGQTHGIKAPQFGPVTGYNLKKVVNYQNEFGEQPVYTQIPYPWPLIRLSDLYLLYAEAMNEVNGPNTDSYDYLNKVRERAGIPTVQDAWANFSTNPSKFSSKDGLRQIIQRERLIELAFEAQRYYDLKRWKTALQEMNNSIKGWDVKQSSVAGYYTPVTLYQQTYTVRDYFWPIKELERTRNPNLVQNIGW